VGRFESDFHGTDLVDASHRIRDALVAHGCPVRLQEVNEGHGWRNWRARAGEALGFLFASQPVMGRGESIGRIQE
jgi:enterochelin esterase-like enzyme